MQVLHGVRPSRPPRPRVMQGLAARLNLKRSQGRPWAGYRAAKRVEFRGADPVRRREGNPKALVASHQAMAKYRLEGISHEKAAHGVQAGQPCRTNTLASDRESPFIKAGSGKTACPVCAADGGEPFNRRLLRPDTDEAVEQRGFVLGGDRGGKGLAAISKALPK